MKAGRAILLSAVLLAPSDALGDDSVRSGATAYGDRRDDAPRVRRVITLADLLRKSISAMGAFDVQ
jgi:hypothetical protein